MPEDTLRYLEDTLRYLDIEARAVSIMGLMKDKDHAVQLLIDEGLKERILDAIHVYALRALR